MEGPASAAAHVGSNTHVHPPGLTFTYAPADIQGLAEPRNGGAGIQVAAPQTHHHASQHLVQGLGQQVQASSPRMHGISSGLSMNAGARASEFVGKKVQQLAS